MRDQRPHIDKTGGLPIQEKLHVAGDRPRSVRRFVGRMRAVVRPDDLQAQGMDLVMKIDGDRSARTPEQNHPPHLPRQLQRADNGGRIPCYLEDDVRQPALCNLLQYEQSSIHC